MKSILVFLFILLSIAPATAEESERAPLSVLVYHHIQKRTTSDVSCTPEAFEAQIKAILDKGLTPLTLHQSEKYLKGELKVDKPVIITFDDGYESLYHYALPTSVKYKVPMTVFVITSRIGQKPQFAKYLSSEQIKEMHDSGFWEFGSHTHDLHTNSMNIYKAFNLPKEKNPVIKILTEDLEESSKTLEKITGVKPFSIAWPYGKFNSAYTESACKAGYTIHFTSLSGRNPMGSNILKLKRYPVTSRDTVYSVLKKAGI